jgi:hypothetical protein
LNPLDIPPFGAQERIAEMKKGKAFLREDGSIFVEFTGDAPKIFDTPLGKYHLLEITVDNIDDDPERAITRMTFVPESVYLQNVKIPIFDKRP